MAKHVLIGLGGMGGRVVANVMSEMKENDMRIDSKEICCAALDMSDEDIRQLKSIENSIHVLSTGREKKLGDYMGMYQDYGIDEWMPMSTMLSHETMRWGSGQMRAISRLAFYDTFQSKGTMELEYEMEKLLEDSSDNSISVTIISSLAGGAGSGMLIQVALWIREFFKRKRRITTIRGILVLPEVFVREGIKDDSLYETMRANAYATIREINTITKIRTGVYNPTERIMLDKFIDSDNESFCKDEPVFDFAFFVDCDMEENKVHSLWDYEKTVARLTYMHMLAPMSDGMYVKEDVAYRCHQLSREPMYGLCDSAKAIYPTESVFEYCTLRAVKDTLSTSWRIIDQKISAMNDKRQGYINEFDTLSQRQDAESELFRKIRADMMNVDIVDGERRLTFKIKDFMKAIEEKVKGAVKEGDIGKINEIKIPKTKEAWLKSKGGLGRIDDAKRLVQTKREDIKIFINEAISHSSELAEQLANEICPLDMGCVDVNNSLSIMGLFTKTDDDARERFIHPIAMRCLLYQILNSLKEKNKCAVQLETLKDSLLEAKQEKLAFDDDALSYLDKKPFFTLASSYIKKFKSIYYDFNKNQYELCCEYVELLVMRELARMLSSRLETLVGVVEKFFGDLDRAYNKVEDGLINNINKTETCGRNSMYVCASRDEKESLYQSLRLNVNKYDKEIYETVAKATYGQLCALSCPDDEDNLRYIDDSAINMFFKEIVNMYKGVIDKNSDKLDLDIYTAICRSVDLNRENDAEEDELSEFANAGKMHKRHLEGMKAVASKLKTISLPIISKDNVEISDTGYDVIFWGFSPKLAESCDSLGEILGINVSSQQSKAYSKNELNCYRSVYGFKAADVDKLNELKEEESGSYYASYKRIVDKMTKAVDEGDEEALVRTPHIDKTWHKILPYISQEKKD